MSVSSIEVTAGSGTHIWTDARTVSAVSRHAQFTLPAPNTYATYTVFTGNLVSIATTADHLLQIMGDGTNYTRLMSYSIAITYDRPASDLVADIVLVRLSTAGTGGGGADAAPHDVADGAYGTTPLTLNSAKGTEGTLLQRHSMSIPTAFPTQHFQALTWEAGPASKPIIFGTAATNGIAFKIVTGVASCSVMIHAELLVTSFL